MIAAIRDNNPVIFVEHRLLYFTEAFVPEEPFDVPFGKARRCTEGNDVTIVGDFQHGGRRRSRAELLAEIGISAEVIDPISLTPLDIETIVASVGATGRLLVVDNAWTTCGASAEIVARVVERLPRRPADPRAADRFCADHLPDYAVARGIFSRPGDDRAKRLCDGAAWTPRLGTRCGALSSLPDEISRTVLHAFG